MMNEPQTSNDLNTFLDTAAPKVTRGRLKIFLGYCAGVGKTYRMLQEGITNRNNGVDVTIGLVESHGRVDTGALINRLEVLPRRNIQYSGIVINEMDLDKILERAPQLVLVDELAHTNIPGSRHAKRYQDVEEILNAGIDVYTTLNIQHVQSVVDIVGQITGVKVEEIIPNWVLDSADEVELVDLSPEKLQQRLNEGKVYIPQKAQVAMHRFFKKGNLLALRELSLKYTAKRVDSDLLTYREQEDISDVWPVESKLLVGISTNKSTEKTLLVAHRMAAELNAGWYAVHVESLQQVHYTMKSKNQLYHNLKLAEELGAKVVSLSGNDVADTLISFARDKNVTLILAGLTQRSRLQNFLHGSILEKLVKKASPINVLVVGDGATPTNYERTIAQPFRSRPYFLSSLGILLLLLLRWFFPHVVSGDNLLMMLLLPSLIAGVLSGVSVGVVSAVLSLAVYDFSFVIPINSFAIADLRYLTNCLLFLGIVSGVSWVGHMIRWRAESAKDRERFVYALYNFSREILTASSYDEILNRSLRSMIEAFDSDVILLLPGTDGELIAKQKNEALILNDMEKAVAVWVYKNGRHAGRGTNTLASAKWYYVPLKTKDQVLGVICVVNSKDERHFFSPEQKRLLEAFAGVVALALTKLSAGSE